MVLKVGYFGQLFKKCSTLEKKKTEIDVISAAIVVSFFFSCLFLLLFCFKIEYIIRSNGIITGSIGSDISEMKSVHQLGEFLKLIFISFSYQKTISILYVFATAGSLTKLASESKFFILYFLKYDESPKARKTSNDSC